MTTDPEAREALARLIREAPIRATTPRLTIDPDAQLKDSDYARADAVIAAGWTSPSGAVDNWQLIESAPRDGSLVQLWLGKPWSRAVQAWWFKPWGTWIKDDDFVPDEHDERFGIGSGIPTHWRPLPEAPRAQDGRSEGTPGDAYACLYVQDGPLQIQRRDPESGRWKVYDNWKAEKP